MATWSSHTPTLSLYIYRSVCECVCTLLDVALLLLMVLRVYSWGLGSCMHAHKHTQRWASVHESLPQRVAVMEKPFSLRGILLNSHNYDL